MKVEGRDMGRCALSFRAPGDTGTGAAIFLEPFQICCKMQQTFFWAASSSEVISKSRLDLHFILQCVFASHSVLVASCRRASHALRGVWSPEVEHCLEVGLAWVEECFLSLLLSSISYASKTRHGWFTQERGVQICFTILATIGSRWDSKGSAC